MSFGGHAPPGPDKELKRFHRFLSCGREKMWKYRKRRKRRRDEGNGKTGKGTRSFFKASRPFAHSASDVRNELLRTQRALMSVSLLVDPTRPAGIPIPVAYPCDYH